MEHPDDFGFTYSSDADWDRAEAYERGAEDPSAAWIHTDRGGWHRNPFYQGPPAPHPEDDSDDPAPFFQVAAPSVKAQEKFDEEWNSIEF